MAQINDIRMLLSYLLSGKKFRHNDWLNGHYWVFHNETILNQNEKAISWKQFLNDIILCSPRWSSVEENEMHSFRMTPKDVGKQIRLKNDSITIISSYNSEEPVYKYKTDLGKFSEYGIHINQYSGSNMAGFV